MDELISKQAAIEAINLWLYCDKDERMPADVIKVLPSVQTEIIHCKDCKFYGRADKRRFYRGSDCLNKRIDTIVPDRDFCSRAEKRGEADADNG